VLNQYGLTQLVNDSLLLPVPVLLKLYPKYNGAQPNLLFDRNMSVFAPVKGWQQVFYNFESSLFNRSETILRRWYNVEGFVPSGVALHSKVDNSDVRVFPNPFNSSVKIIADPDASISVYSIIC